MLYDENRSTGIPGVDTSSPTATVACHSRCVRRRVSDARLLLPLPRSSICPFKNFGQEYIACSWVSIKLLVSLHLDICWTILLWVRKPDSEYMRLGWFIGNWHIPSESGSALGTSTARLANPEQQAYTSMGDITIPAALTAAMAGSPPHLHADPN